MAGFSDRTKDGIERWVTTPSGPENKSWAERISDWFSGVIRWGIEIFMDAIGQAFAPKLKPLIENIESTGEVPEVLKPILEEMKDPKGEVAAFFGASAGGAATGGLISSTIGPFLKLLEYRTLSLANSWRLTESLAIALYWRDPKLFETYVADLRDLGLTDERIDILKLLTEQRLDPTGAMLAWRRNPEKFEVMLNDLKQQGWSDDRIEALKTITEFYPSPQDLVTWIAREVFEEDAIEKYGLADEFEKLDLSLFSKAGVSEEQARNYWIAHWQHASFTQIVEMLHRGLVTEDDMWDWFRLVEVPPYWRQKLIDISWNVPTRVDVRRFYDMRTIDEERLREIYTAQGYHGQDLEDYILWTKVYTDFPVMLNRFSKGWITQEELYQWLIDTGIPEERAKMFIEEKVAPESPERTTNERDLTKSEIVKGVKNGLIPWEVGLELLQDMGYDEFEADYILTVNIGALEGSPHTYTEFKDWTQKYRRAIGRDSDVPSSEMVAASQAVWEAEEALKGAESDGKTGSELAPFLEAVATAKRAFQLAQDKHKQDSQQP